MLLSSFASTHTHTRHTHTHTSNCNVPGYENHQPELLLPAPAWWPVFPGTKRFSNDGISFLRLPFSDGSNRLYRSVSGRDEVSPDPVAPGNSCGRYASGGLSRTNPKLVFSVIWPWSNGTPNACDCCIVLPMRFATRCSIGSKLGQCEDTAPSNVWSLRSRLTCEFPSPLPICACGSSMM